MIPAFNDQGNLPVGIHTTTFDEFKQQFGFNVWRQTLLLNLRDLIDSASRIGGLRIVIGGSFVTNKAEPGDIDAILVVSNDFDAHTPDAHILAQAKTLFNVHLFIERERNQERINLWLKFFGHDRNAIPKGLVEIDL